MRNKKKILIFLILFVTLLAIPSLFLIMNRPKHSVLVNKVSSIDEVNQFYYRAVPGLKMAEENGMVQDVNKQLEWPGRDSIVVIDRIWYNTKSINVFYHIEGMSEAAYLGGEMYLPSSEPSKKQPFHGMNNIGRPGEKGIVLNESFYSCLKLPPICDNFSELVTDIDVLTYTPYINIPSNKNKDLLEAVPLKTFEIALNFHVDEEPVTKIPVSALMEFNDRQLSFYQVNISPSSLRIYFQYLNSSKDRVYRVKGTYATDKGEVNEFDAYTSVMTEYPYHYSIDIPPLHIVPDNLQLSIDSIYCTGSDSVSFEINTRQYNGKSKSYNVEVGKNQIKGTDILIEEIVLSRQSAEVLITTKPSADTVVPYMRIDLSHPQMYRNELDKMNRSNILTIVNEDYQLYNLDKHAIGIKSLPEKGIYINLERDYWDSSNLIRINIKNLNYVHKIDMKTNLALDHQST